MLEKQVEFDIVLEPNRLQKEYFKDLFRFRELFYFLAWRDIKVRYKQAVLGVSWVIIRPLITMLVFAFVFGKIANLPSSNVNYSLFVLAGLLPWLFFSSALNDSTGSLLNNANLISKVYFPRFIVLASCIVVNFVDFLIASGMMLCVLVLSGEIHSWSILTLPFFMILTLYLCVGIGLWFSALTVRFRDLRFIVQFIVQFGIFISPVGYSSVIIPLKWQWLFLLNPLVGIIDGFRWAIFGIDTPYLGLSIVSAFCISTFFVATGFLYFRKIERTIADII